MPMESTMALTMAATVLKPVMYLPAPSDTPRMTGLLVSSQAVRTALVHSRLLMLNWGTP